MQTLIFRSFFAILFFCTSLVAFSQSEKDSLLNQVSTSKDPVVKANSLVKLAAITRDKDVEQAKKYASEALFISQTNNLCAIEVGALTQLGLIMRTGGSTEQSINYFDDALDKLKTCPSSGTRAKILVNKAEMLGMIGKIEESLALLNEAESDILKDGDQLKIANFYNGRGSTYDDAGRFDEAIKEYDRSYDLYIKAGSIDGALQALGNEGIVYRKQAKFDKALECYMTVIQKAETAGLDQIAAGAYLNSGNVFNQLSNYGQAEQNYLKAQESFNKIKNIRGQMVAFHCLASVCIDSDRLEEGIQFLGKAEGIALTRKDNLALAKIYNNYGSAYYKLKRYDKSVDYYKRAIKLKKQGNAESSLGDTYSSLAQAYFSMGDLKEASETIDLAIKICKKYEEMEILREALLIKSDIDKASGKLNESILALKEAEQLEDSIYQLESVKIINDLNTKYHTKEKEASIQTLTKEQLKKDLTIKAQKERNLMLTFIIGSIALLLIVVIFFYFRIRNLNKDISYQKQIATTANEAKEKLFKILSHDLRSPLGTVVTRLKKNNMPELAMDVSKTLSMLDNTLTWIRTKSEDLKPEPVHFDMQELVDEVFLEQQLLADSKKISLFSASDNEVPVFADEEMMRVALRNIVNNAIKFSEVSSIIKAEFNVQESYVSLSIQDSGKNLPVDIIQKINRETIVSTPGSMGEQGLGIGLTISNQFLQLNGATLTARTNDDGGEFIIEIPKA